MGFISGPFQYQFSIFNIPVFRMCAILIVLNEYDHHWYKLHGERWIEGISICSEQVFGGLMLEALGLTGRQWKRLRICYNNSLIRQKQEVDKQYLLSGFLLEASTFVVGPSPKTGTLPCQSYFHFDAEQHSSLLRGSVRALCQNTLSIALNLFK